MLCTQGKWHMEMKMEIKMMLLQAKEYKSCQPPTRSWERGMKQIIPHRLQEEPTLWTP